MNLKFQEPARVFSPNTLYAARYNTPSVNIDDLDVTIALDRETAQTAVSNMLANKLLMKRTYKWMLPRKYIAMEPSDAVRMPNKFNPNVWDQYYITQVNIGANGLLEVHAMDHFYVDPNLKPTDQVPEDLDVAVAGNTDLPSTSQTVAFLLDLPLLTDNEADKPGFYVRCAARSPVARRLALRGRRRALRRLRLWPERRRALLRLAVDAGRRQLGEHSAGRRPEPLAPA